MPLPKILYAEDYKLVAHYMKEILEMEGWLVDVCTDGLAALEKIESDTAYNLLLLDDQMPGMNGIKLVERARELPHRKYTPIIILSGSNCKNEAKRAGANVFLKKPDDFRLLITAIMQLLDMPECS
jgi:two-component system chemotaxis response regulator CheY